MPVLKVANIHFNAAGTHKLEWQNDTDNIVRIQAGAIRVPIGTTGSRPTGTSGLIRYNTTTGALEGYNASAWGTLTETASIDSATRALFVQTTAPTGWTKLTANNNHALRVVTGTAANGGTVDFTTAFASRTPTGSIAWSGTTGTFTLTTNELPGHTHGIDVTNSSAVTAPNTWIYSYTATADTTQTTSPTGGGGSHSHPATGLTATFNGTPIDLAVRYVDVIICSKD